MFEKFQSKESTPGGSKQGSIAAKKIKVTGVVSHINLLFGPQIRQEGERNSVMQISTGNLEGTLG